MNIENLHSSGLISCNFADALNSFLPSWIESIVPHYHEAKRQGVELLALSNYLISGSQDIIYKSNNIAYYLMENKVLGGRELAFDASDYQQVGWRECFERDYPTLFKDQTQRVCNFIGIDSYMSRLSNLKEPYDIIARQVDECFKQLTGDPHIGFSLGNTSFVYFTDKAKDYINRNHYLD